MSDYFAPLLLSLCTGTVGNYHAACESSINSAYAQSGYQAQVSTFQGQVANFGKHKEHEILGSNDTIANTLVATGMVVKQKKVDLSLPNLGLCDRFSTQLQPEKYQLKIEWKW
jgi:hypothetical protein